MFDLVGHLKRQRAFSRGTFGPGQRMNGVIQHIRKELKELEAIDQESGDARVRTQVEWMDVIILALDGAWRSGLEPEEIARRLEAKQDVNEVQDWPDWRGRSEDEAIEHERSPEEQARKDAEAPFDGETLHTTALIFDQVTAEERDDLFIRRETTPERAFAIVLTEWRALKERYAALDPRHRG